MALSDPNGVKQMLNNECRRTQTHIENIGAILACLTDSAEKLGKSQYAGGVDSAKENFKKILEVEEALTAHSQATAKLRLQYKEPGEEEETDFNALLQALTQQYKERSTFDTEKSEKYRQFLTDISEFSPGEAPEDEDDDLRIERSGGQLAKNRMCPVSQVELLEMEDPVEDQVGYVYEKQAIFEYFTRHGNIVQCPYAGATHQVQKSDLKPARKVLRAQKRAHNNLTKALPRADEADIQDV